MTEQTVVKQNFFGKDQFQWWLGQVTDPETGKWEKTLQTQKVEDKNEVYYYRVRTRILGYHGNADELPDDQLPFAHVLGPANQSFGVNGEGDLLGLQGGEIVLGFFLDGEDGQQPVIFGTLYRNRDVKVVAPEDRKTSFEPFSPEKYALGKHVIDKASKTSGIPSSGVSNNESSDEVTVAKDDFEASTDITITPPNPCGSSGVGEISAKLNDFSKLLSRLKNIDGQYIDKIMGKIIDIENEVKTIASSIFATVSGLIAKIRTEVMKLVYEALTEILKLITPKPLQSYTGQATKVITDSIFCLFENLLGDVFSYLFDSIMNFVDSVVSFTQCVVDSFMGDMFSQISSILDTLMGSILSAAGVAGSIGSIIDSALSGLGFLSSLFSCDKVGCFTPHQWSTRLGTAKMLVDDFTSLFESNPLDVSISGIDQFSTASVGTPNCSIDLTQIFPPIVEFNGNSTDTSASGTVMVNDFGEIVGVAITNPGSYTEPPLVTFIDPSTPTKNGSGAGGVAILGVTSTGTTGVVDVVIINSGGGYATSTTTYNAGQSPQSSGGTVMDNYTCELVKVIVIDTGFGYQKDATVTIGSCTFALKVSSDGNILSVNVNRGKCGLDCSRKPKYKLNSKTGIGAKLKIVLRYTRIDPINQSVGIGIDDSGTSTSVIDCVGK